MQSPNEYLVSAKCRRHNVDRQFHTIFVNKSSPVKDPQVSQAPGTAHVRYLVDNHRGLAILINTNTAILRFGRGSYIS